MEETTYRDFQAEDLKGQKDLFARCFSEVKDSPAYGDTYFKWKFSDRPTTPPAHQFVADLKGEIVGYYAALPIRYKINDQTASAALVVDVMVHPKTQGQGVFRKLGLFAMRSLKARSCDFTIGYVVRPQVMPGHLKVGWKVAMDLPVYVSVLSGASILRAKKCVWLLPLLQPLVKLQALCIDLFLRVRSARGRADVVVGDARVADSDFWDFQRRWLERQSIAWVRTPETLAWRLSKPAASYHSILWRNTAGAVTAHALVSPTVLQDVSTLAILDFQTLEPGSLFSLHRAIRSLAKKLRCDTVSVMTPAASAERVKRRAAGFVRPAKFQLIINNLSEKFPNALLHDPFAWHIFWLDTDTV